MCPSCPQASLYFIYAITTTLFSLLHIGWMMIACEGYSEIPQKKGYLKVIWVILSHYGASFAVSELNNKRSFDPFLWTDNAEFIHINQLWMYRLHLYLPVHHPRLFIHHHLFTQIKIQTFALALPINLEWNKIHSPLWYKDPLHINPCRPRPCIIIFFINDGSRGAERGKSWWYLWGICIFSF